VQVRDSTGEDIPAVVALYPRAFPEEDLVPLVTALLEDTSIRMSLVATMDGQIIGNVIFTTCGVEGDSVSVALLAPLAVAPDCQRQGVGSALVKEGLNRLTEAGCDLVCVLGDPAYYGRLGFTPESSIEAPYALPPEWTDAWQSQRLGDVASCAGKLLVPAQWQHAGLWTG
jgi:putative acetyltransferase